MKDGWKISVDLGGLWLLQAVMLLVALIWPDSARWWYALMPVWFTAAVILGFWSVCAADKIIRKIKNRKK